MPDVSKLSPKDKARLLGCVKQKNERWKKENRKPRVPADVNERHFSECAKKLGLE